MATTEIRSNSIILAYQCNKQTNKQTNKHAFLFVNSLGYGNSEAAKRCRRIGRDLRQFVRSVFMPKLSYRFTDTANQTGCATVRNGTLSHGKPVRRGTLYW